jgi:Fe-S cluster biogenesis protein NfuA
MSQSPTTPAPPGNAPGSAAGAAAPAKDASLFQRVIHVINRIRPAVQSDGGDVELVEVTKEGVARIRLHGACVGCPSSQMTLHMGIERNIREKVPEITGVEQVH